MESCWRHSRHRRANFTHRAPVGCHAPWHSYDGFGRRTSRAPNGSRVDAWYDASGLTLETGAAPGTYLRDPSGMLLSAFSSADLRHYGRDRLGSVTALVDGEHNVDNLYRYDPWGNRTTSSGTAINPFKFTGHYQSTNSGLFDFGARTYDPGAGRFTQADPYPDNLLGPSRYAYAGCNPTNFVDPSGLQLEAVIGSCVKGIAGGLLVAAVATPIWAAVTLSPLALPSLGAGAGFLALSCPGGIVGAYLIEPLLSGLFG